MDVQKTLLKTRNFRAQYDFVTARAVARMQVLAELTIPYLKVGGRLLALKASNAPEELEEAKGVKELLSVPCPGSQGRQTGQGQQCLIGNR